MQDQPLKLSLPNGGILVREEAPAGQLPPTFVAQLASAEAVILVTTTESGGLALQPVLPGGTYAPEHMASHALVAAITEALPQLVRRVSGYPTHADRYLAFQKFALMEQTDAARYEAINTMLQHFEEDNLKDGEKATAEYMDRAADFLVHTMAETEPTMTAPTAKPN